MLCWYKGDDNHNTLKGKIKPPKVFTWFEGDLFYFAQIESTLVLVKFRLLLFQIPSILITYLSIQGELNAGSEAPYQTKCILPTSENM
jgi:hypothetical protein